MLGTILALLVLVIVVALIVSRRGRTTSVSSSSSEITRTTYAPQSVTSQKSIDTPGALAQQFRGNTEPLSQSVFDAVQHMFAIKAYEAFFTEEYIQSLIAMNEQQEIDEIRGAKDDPGFYIEFFDGIDDKETLERIMNDSRFSPASFHTWVAYFRNVEPRDRDELLRLGFSSEFISEMHDYAEESQRKQKEAMDEYSDAARHPGRRGW